MLCNSIFGGDDQKLINSVSKERKERNKSILMKRNIILARECCSIYRKKEREGNFIMQSVSCARGPGFDPRQRRGKFVGPNLLSFVSFAGMT